MADGFLGYPSTFMLDVVVCALALVIPALVYSLFLVKVRKNYVWHRNIQVTLGAVLLVTVFLFELDMRLHGGWRNILARRSRPLTAEEMSFVAKLLGVHLCFAISTVFLWTMTLVLALRRFANPPHPATHSPLHRGLGWASMIDITLTSLTGLAFYYLAFVVR